MKTKSRVAMPIISEDIESLELVKDGGKNTGIRVSIKTVDRGQMQAMVDSDFYLVRKKEELFAYKPKQNAILFRLQPSAKKFWPFSFVNSVAAIAYEGVDEKTVLSDLHSPLSRLGETALSNLVKLATGKGPKVHPNIVVNRYAHIAAFIDALVAPKKLRNDLSKWDGVAVRGGDNIGYPAKSASGRRELIVRFATLKLGEVKFIDPLPVLKEFPGFVRTLDNHKFKSWVDNYREPIRFYLRFEFWNPVSRKYQAVDWKPECQVIVDGQVFEEGYYLDNKGKVFIEVPGNKASGIKKKELYFRLNLGKKKIGSIVFPENWTTKNVTGKYSIPGYFKSFPGFSIGNGEASAVFRVGTRVYLEFRYRDHYADVLQRAKKAFMASGLNASKFRFLDIPRSAFSQYGKARSLTKGMLVWAHFKGPGSYMYRQTTDKDHWLRVDDAGRIDTVLFDHGKPQSKLYLECYMDMQNQGEGLPDIRIYKKTIRDILIQLPLRWKKDIQASTGYSGIVGDHTGSDAKPLIVNIQGGKNDLHIQNALYSLKKIRETHGWLRCLSKGHPTSVDVWKSPPLMIALVENVSRSDQAMGPPFSIRLGMDQSYVISKGKKKIMHTDLALVRPRHIVHEFGHFVMAASIEKTKARRLAFNRKLRYVSHGKAFFRAPSNPNSALIEGWARFFSHCFGYADFYKPAKGEPVNNGEKIAQDVAIALFELFQKEVLGASATAFKYFGESPNGDPLTAVGNYCSSSRHYPLFTSYIWRPLLDMEKDYQAVIDGSAGTFGIRQFCQRIINRNGRMKWNNDIKKHFVIRNMAKGL